MKRKIFTTLAVFLSLALVTGCNNVVKESSEVSSEEQQQSLVVSSEPANTSSKKHTHKWVSDDSKTDVPATCTQEGIKYEKCECGETRETKVAKTDHAYGEWTDLDGATCGQRGQQQRKCANCDATETRSVGVIPHAWQVTNTVEAADGGIEYSFIKCSKCQKEGLWVAVKNADNSANNMVVTGSPKTSPAGTVKLGTNNDSMTAVIKLAEDKSGKFYVRGSMDYWYTSNNQNEQKGIFNGKSGGGADKANHKANFKVEYGTDAAALTEMEITSDTDLLYKDWLPEEPGFTSVADTDWSQIGDIEVGDITLAAGLNTIKLTRTDSYNLAFSHFVVVFNAAA